MRGVYGGDLVHVGVQAGSSPHARGLPHDGVADGPQGGIIPACAGFTSPEC